MKVIIKIIYLFLEKYSPTNSWEHETSSHFKNGA